MERDVRYQCSKCGVLGVRLYRQSAVSADSVTLMCRTCSIIDQAEGIDGVKGHDPLEGSDQIWGRCPAVPDRLPYGPEWWLGYDFSWWGYTSVPRSGVAWWESLPVSR